MADFFDPTDVLDPPSAPNSILTNPTVGSAAMTPDQLATYINTPGQAGASEIPGLITQQYETSLGRAPTAAELQSDSANAIKYGWDSGPNGGVQATIANRATNLQPSSDGGSNGSASSSANTLGSLMGGTGGTNGQWTGTFTPPTQADVAATPGYQFGLSEQQRALQQQAAARGDLLTGRTAQAEAQAAGNYADTNYQQAYNNAFNNYLNQQGQFNQNFTNANTTFNQGLASNYLNLFGQNQAYNQNLGLNYLNLFGQNQNFTQGQTAQQNQFSDYLGYQNLIKPPNPLVGA